MRRAGCTSAAIVACIALAIAAYDARKPIAMPHDSRQPQPTDTPVTTATVDAIEEGVARILVGEYPETVYTVATDRLPKGAMEGVSLQIEGPLTEGLAEARLVLDPAATQQRRERVRDKLERLRRGGDE